MRFGVDEAGKGPVLGSMFVAAVRGPPPAIPEEVDDSKRLTETKREAIASELRADSRLSIEVSEVTPKEIDTTNMNALTVGAHADVINAIAEDGDHGVCDAADVDASRFESRVRSQLNAAVTLDATHGADTDDPFVAAASIIAKSERERHVDVLKNRFGEVGSGYPSDPKTRAFLRQYFSDHGAFPAGVRTSWATCDSIRAESEQTDIEEF